MKPNTVEIETAAQAWIEVQGFIESDKKVTIVDPHGRTIGWQELRVIARNHAVALQLLADAMVAECDDGRLQLTAEGRRMPVRGSPSLWELAS